MLVLIRLIVRWWSFWVQLGIPVCKTVPAEFLVIFQSHELLSIDRQITFVHFFVILLYLRLRHDGRVLADRHIAVASVHHCHGRESLHHHLGARVMVEIALLCFDCPPVMLFIAVFAHYRVTVTCDSALPVSRGGAGLIVLVFFLVFHLYNLMRVVVWVAPTFYRIFI